MLDAQLGELRRIWQDTDIGPAPARPGGPRVLVGGDARYAGPRAARHGDGWTMMVGTPADFAAGIEVVRGCWTAAGRPGAPATMAVFYAALGDDAPHLVEKAVGGYYAWLGRDIAGYIVGTAATSGRRCTSGWWASRPPAPTRSWSCPAPRTPHSST